MATIKIRGDSGYADRLRAYHIVLDGENVMKVSNEKTGQIYYG